MTNINATINEHLQDLSDRYGCRILFAGESGSRAWGLSSPDSDYDVRFLYAHPMRWYLSIEDRRDTIETVFPDDIDMVGKELRVWLRLFSTCNMSLNEQIQSPIVYQEEPGIRDRLVKLIPTYFVKKRALFQYIKIAEQAITQGLDGLSIGLNRLFYVVRPLLACEWIMANESMPPTEFQTLLEADFLPLIRTNEITELIQKKSQSRVTETINLSKELVYWMTETLKRHQENFQLLPQATEPVSLDPLNELFQNVISEGQHEPGV